MATSVNDGVSREVKSIPPDFAEKMRRQRPGYDRVFDLVKQYDDLLPDKRARLQRQTEVVATRKRAERLALEEQARQVLLQAALVELALGQQPDLFEREALPMAFTEAAVTGLRHHGYPFAPLLRLVNVEGLSPSPTDPFYTNIQGESRESLKPQFVALRERAAGLLNVLANAPDQEETAQDISIEVQTSLL